MSFKLNVKCVRKTESIEGDNTYTEITLQPEPVSITQPVDNPQPLPTFGMMNGMTLTIRDTAEADAYKVGDTYQISVGAAATTTTSAKQETK